MRREKGLSSLHSREDEGAEPGGIEPSSPAVALGPRRVGRAASGKAPAVDPMAHGVARLTVPAARCVEKLLAAWALRSLTARRGGRQNDGPDQ